LLQAKAIIPFFKMLKEEGFNTCIDTNGSVLNDDVKELLKYTDIVLLDIKEFNEQDTVALQAYPTKLRYAWLST